MVVEQCVGEWHETQHGGPSAGDPGLHGVAVGNHPDLDAALEGPRLAVIVGGNRLALAEGEARDHLRVHTVRDQRLANRRDPPLG